jgi:putative ABC transport system permease protein
LFVWQGFRVVALGLAIGVAAALVLTRFLSSLLYGVNPADPATFAATTLLLCTVSLAATYLPARRAAALDPLRVLRQE